MRKLGGACLVAATCSDSIDDSGASGTFKMSRCTSVRCTVDHPVTLGLVCKLLVLGCRGENCRSRALEGVKNFSSKCPPTDVICTQLHSIGRGMYVSSTTISK